MVEMSRNLLQAAARCKLALAAALVILMQYYSTPHCLADTTETKHTDVCPKTLWRIDFNDSFKQGEALLQFDIPYQDKV